MREYIKTLQDKSENKRKQILVVSLIVSMVFVSSIWIYGLEDHFGAKPQAKAVSTTEEKPFALFGDSLTGTYKNLVASVGNISFAKKKDLITPPKQIDLIVVDNAVKQ